MFHALIVYRPGLKHHFTRVPVCHIIYHKEVHTRLQFSGKWRGNKKTAKNCPEQELYTVTEDSAVNVNTATVAESRDSVKQRCAPLPQCRSKVDHQFPCCRAPPTSLGEWLHLLGGFKKGMNARWPLSLTLVLCLVRFCWVLLFSILHMVSFPLTHSHSTQHPPHTTDYWLTR